MTLPDKFDRMIADLGCLDGLLETLATTEPSTSIRLNPAKSAGYTADGDIVPWEPRGRYLNDRPAFTFDPAMYSGRYYVQDASSMIIGEITRRLTAGRGPLRVLDACAAPGGKTTAILDNLPSGSFVLANEYESGRVDALVDNLERWGAPAYAVANVDARRLGDVGSVFDLVFSDVPCSGEGMMRKNETAVAQWSPRLVESCAELQRDIVAAIWKTLRPGGYLVYSTCTFNTVENEDNAEWICNDLGAEPVNLHLSDYPGVMAGINTEVPCARFIPGRIRGEGLFVAVFRKPENAEVVTSKKVKPVKPSPSSDWISGDYTFRTDRDGTLYAVATLGADIVDTMTALKLKLASPGIPVATPKGRDTMPAPGLATSTALNTEAFARVDVDWPTAVAYLSGEALRLDSGVPRGYVLVTYQGYPLGFVKNIGNRANNLYPAPRRIRSSHRPITSPSILTFPHLKG